MIPHDQQHTESPEMLSLMGYSIAREAGQFRKGIELCLKAIAMDPHNSRHYLHLGRIYLLAKKKDIAIKVFKKGLKTSKDPKIIAELSLLGTRRSPTFSSLPRQHIVNRMFGRVLHALTPR